MAKIDDDLPDHPKFLSVGPVAAWGWLRGLCWCRKYLTDGFIPKQTASTLLGSATEIAKLLQEKLCHEVEGGYMINDYLEHNPSKARVLQVRKMKARAGRLGGQAKGKQTASKVPSKKNDFATTMDEAEKKQGGVLIPPLNGFKALWSLNPKGSKREAITAYKKVRPPESAIEALKGQIAHKLECDKRGKFCAELQDLHRWIKKRRWEDEIPAIPLTQTERLWLEGQAEEEANRES